MAPTKQKVLLLQSKQGSLAVAERDVPKPGPNQLLVKTLAAALNPLEWKIQEYGIWIQEYPAILGCEGAGIVEAVGEGVTNFKVGDKVFTQGDVATESATYQQYFLAEADITAKVPNNLSFEEVVSVPAGLVAPAFGLYNASTPEHSVGLTPPWVEGGEGKYAQQPLVVLGGASSLGQFAIQLGKLSGFSPIITTASLHNTDYLKSLGATHVLDRKLASAELAAAVKGITSSPVLTAFDAVSTAETQNAAYDLLASGGTVVLVLQDEIDAAKKTPEKKAVFARGIPSMPINRELARTLYAKLTGLLEKGVLKPNRVEVIEGGLAGVPVGLTRLKENKVSGQKLVVRPQETK